MKSRFLIRGDGRRHEASLREWIAGFIAAIAWVLLVTGLPRPAMSQAVFGAGDANLTVEAYANSSAGVSDDGVFQFDGALRLLGLVPLASQSKLGARAVVEALAGERSEVDLGELSVLWLDRWGRIEYGERQGLPDVLVGYAPNNFTFTGAEFGPASGLSLDPGSGLASILLDRPESGRLLRMASLGATATLASDRSDKIIYVSPKRHGFIGGLSYAHDAGENGDRYGSLFQAGLTHERYVGENVLRYGGSVSVADVDGGENLRSWNGGISATLHDSWLLGVSAGYDSGGIDADSAWGNGTSRVLSGCNVRPYLPNRFGSAEHDAAPLALSRKVVHPDEHGTDPDPRTSEAASPFHSSALRNTSTRCSSCDPGLDVDAE
jgi:hypothetical protein